MNLASPLSKYCMVFPIPIYNLSHLYNYGTLVVIPELSGNSYLATVNVEDSSKLFSTIPSP